MFSLRRLQMHWRSLLTLIVGVLFATMIGALLPLYTASVNQVIMVQHLTGQQSSNTHLHLRTTFSVQPTTGYSQLITDFDNQLEAVIQDRLSAYPGWFDALIHWGESASAFVTVNAVEQEIKASVAYYDALFEHVELIDGALPAEPLQAVIDHHSASLLNVGVGDVLTLDQRGWDSSVPFDVTIAGIIQARDEDEAYFMQPSPLRAGNTVNLFVSTTDFEQVLTDYMPDASAQIGWRVFFDHNALYHGRLSSAIEAIAALESDVQRVTEQSTALDVFQIQTGLTEALQMLNNSSDNLNTAFILVLLQTGALVLFFLYVMGTMVRRSTSDELNLWRSRGGDDRQLLLLVSLEFFIVCLLVALVTPFLVYLFLLAYIPLLTGISSLQLSISASTFGFALLWSGFAFVILLLLYIPIIRRPLSINGDIRYERENKQPLWQRLYLDVVLLIVGLIALISGFQDSTHNAEALQNDPLFLILPTILFFATGSLLLRLFPIVLAFITRIISTGNSLIGLLATLQVSRSPRHYAQISLLLALSIGMGWFALSFQVTLLQNQSDQASYAVGADVRLIGDESAMDAVATPASVESRADALRYSDIDLAPNTQLLSFTSGDLLMVDHDRLQDVVIWRDDLGVIPVPLWDETLPETGQALPADTVELVMQLQLFSPQAIENEDDEVVFASDAVRLGYFFDVLGRFRDDNGAIITVPFQVELPDSMPELPEQDRFVEELPETDIDILTFRARIPDAYQGEPLRLDMLNIGTSDPTFRSPLEQGVILAIEGIDTLNSSDERVPLDWVSTATWQPINDQGNDQNIETPQIQAFIDDYPAQAVAWAQRDGVGRISVAIDYPVVTSLSTDDTLQDDEIQAMSAVISQRYAEENELKIGQKFRISVNQTALWLEVQAITSYFPTLYDAQAPFIIVPLAPAVYSLNRNPFGRAQANEAWIRVQGSPAEQAEQISEDAPLLEVIDRESMATTFQNDLFTLGLIGLLLLSSLIGIILSLLSLITYTVLNTRERQNEFAILRALGWTNDRVIILGLLEQVLVVFIALIVGLGIGILLSVLVLPGLSITADGVSAVPPFRVEFSPEVFMIYIAVLLVVFLIQFGVTVLLVNRTTHNRYRVSL